MVDGCRFISGCTFYIYLNSFYTFVAVEFFDFPLGRSLGSTWQPKQAERFSSPSLRKKKKKKTKRIMYTFIVDGQFLIAATGHLFCLTKLASTTQRPTCPDSHCLTHDPAASSSWPLSFFCCFTGKAGGSQRKYFLLAVGEAHVSLINRRKFMNGPARSGICMTFPHNGR